MRRRFRFSLFGLLALTLIVALAASNYVAYRRLQEVEPALEKLRNEVGELTIGDDRLLHAIAIPSFEDSTYRWRLHLPKGRKFYLHAVAGSKIPEGGLPRGASRDTFVSEHILVPPDGEVLTTIAINKDQQGRWRLLASVASQSTFWKPLPDELQSWLETPNSRSAFAVARGKTISVPSGEPLVLLQVRKIRKLPGGGVTHEVRPTEGIAVWIDEGKK
jgi:hypothetical protein